MIAQYLNKNPVSLFIWKESYKIPVNFDDPLENQVLLFSFVDENMHLMNITLEGKDKLRMFTQMVDLDQVEGVKNYTIEILME